MMEIKGKIRNIFETQIITDTFKKREMVIEYAENPEYPEYLKIEFVQDKVSLLDSYKEGQIVTVAINLRGRIYNHPEKGEMFFNTLLGWKISGGEAAPGPTETAPAEREYMDKDDNSDLPFILTLLIASSFLIQSIPI